MSTIFAVIEDIAALAQHEDYTKTAESSIEAILEGADVLKDKPRKLFAVKKVIKEKLERNWNEVLNQNGPQLVDLCVQCVNPAEEPVAKPKKKPKEKKAATKRTPKEEKPKNGVTAKAKPVKKEKVEAKAKEEPKKEEATAEAAAPTEEAPKATKRKPKRRQSAKTKKPDVEKTPKEVKKTPKPEVQEVMTGVALKDIEKLHQGLEEKVGNAMATILEDNKRTREMVQDLWTQQRQMLLDENYLPPETLKGWDD